MSSDEETLLGQYDQSRAVLVEYTFELERLVSRLLAARGIRPHLVSGRIKTRDSFMRKVVSAPGRYASLTDLTDVVGIRVVTYVADDVDRVGRCIVEEFRVHDRQSVDKRQSIEPDRFGYLSLHYVVELAESRAALLEYARFRGLVAEVQIRSILQHAWAEIEHDLGYKTELAVPREARREFSRIAGLLEVADASFVSLRNQLTAYENGLSRKISMDPSAVPIDKASLKVFLRASAIIAALNAQVLATAGGVVIDADDDILQRHVVQLGVFGITTIADLERSLHKEADAIGRFLKLWISGPSPAHGNVLPLVFLEYLLLARCDDSEIVERFFSSTDYPVRRDLLERLRAACASAKI